MLYYNKESKEIPMKETDKSLKRFFELLLGLTEKEIKARYKKAVLGFFWIFLNPLVQMGIIGFVFAFVFRKTVPNYYIFILSGLLPWNFFSLSADYGTVAITANRDLVKKSPFPKATLPLSIIFSNLNNFFISILLVTAFLLFTRQLESIAIITLLPLVVLWQIIFTSGLTLFTSALHPFFRDVSFIMRALLRVWFYATPIIYPISIIPEKFHPLFFLNPMSSIVLTYQRVFAKTKFPFTPQVVALQIVLTILILILGVITFRKKEKEFADWL